MPYVIYNKETTKTLLAPARSVGCYIEHYKTEGAAKAALTRLAKKDKLGEVHVTDVKTLTRTTTKLTKDDYAIAELEDFLTNIERTVKRRNAMTGEEFEERTNANYATSPASEAYWCS